MKDGHLLAHHIRLLNGRIFQKLLSQDPEALYRGEQGKILAVLWNSETGCATATDIALATGLLTTAEEAGIKYQYYCGKGGTDAGAAHLKNGGVPSTTIGVCARYIHSHQTLYAMDDFLEAQAFLQALVKKLDRSTVDLIKHY
ncbi:glutamyl aminopeptidase [Streptococcus pneumoniae]|nr:glutamyl aminopeptidase [Streptococcus pneumoniae]